MGMRSCMACLACVLACVLACAGDLKPENVLLKRDLSSPITMTAKITGAWWCCHA